MTAGAVTVAFVLRGEGFAGSSEDDGVAEDGVTEDGVTAGDGVTDEGVTAGDGLTEDGVTAGDGVAVEAGLTEDGDVIAGDDESDAGLESVTFDTTGPTFPRTWLTVDTICSYASRPARLPRT